MFIKIILIAMLSGLASVLANKGIAVFNDGLRPLVPEHLEGRLDRKSLLATSFALSFGLVIGFGIPFSIGKSIILIHSILLGTDIIGTAFKNDNKGSIFSAVSGAIYGIGLVLGLQVIVDLFAKLPVNFLPNLSEMGTPIIVAFAVFPVLVIGYQYGVKKGVFSLFIVLIVRQLISIFGKISVGEATISLNSDGIALFVGIVVMLVFAIMDKTESTGSNTKLLGIFSERVAKVKKNIIILSIMGGLVASAVSLNMLAGDPISLNLIQEGKMSDAGIVALARTGVYGPTGLTFVFAIGIFIKNPILAFIIGAITLSLEILLLEQIAKLLDKFPGIKACGDQIRTSMTKVLEVAILVGAMIACNNMAGGNGLGFLFVIGFYLLNKSSKKPLVDMAVGPIATILFGIILNILFILNLFVPVVAK